MTIFIALNFFRAIFFPVGTKGQTGKKTLTGLTFGTDQCNSMAKQFTLGKNERLKSRKQIEQLFAAGKSFAVYPYKIFYVAANDQRPTANALQFGVGASTRNFKKAVDRNRVKRITRENWRLQKNDLKSLLTEKKFSLNVFFIYTGKELPEYNFVKEKTTVILNKLIKIINESNIEAA